jgi:tetratricopeptide (TPR) repeat protein
MNDQGIEAAWQRLRRHVSWSDQPSIGFVVCPSRVEADLLRDRTDWQLRSRGRHLRCVLPSKPSELATAWSVVEAQTGHGVSVWLQQTASDPPGSEATPWHDAWCALLRGLNHRRDHVREQLGDGTLYIVGTRGLPVVAREYAPDVWSVRAFVIDSESATSLPVAAAESRHTDTDEEAPAGGLLAGVRITEEGEHGRELAQLLRRAERAAMVGDDVIAIELATEVMARATDERTRGLAQLLRAVSRGEAGDAGGAQSDGLAALDVLRRHGPVRLAWLDLVARGSASLGRLDIARQIDEEALALARRADEERSTPETRHNLSASLNKLGDVARAQGDLERAEAAYQESLTIRRELDHTQGTPQTRRNLSVSLDHVGDVARAQGDLERAEAAHHEALVISQELDRALSTPQTRRDLAISHSRIGDVARRLGDLERAAAAYQESLTIRRELDHTQGTSKSRRDLSVGLDRVGDAARARGDLDRAAAAYQESLTISQELDRALSTPQTRRDLAISHGRIGDVARTLGDIERAEAAYQEALAITRELHRALGTLESRRDLAHTLREAGNTARASGDRRAIERFAAELDALSEDAETHGLDVDRQGMRELAARLRAPLDESSAAGAEG